MWKIDQFNDSKTKQLSIGDGNRLWNWTWICGKLYSVILSSRQIDINDNGFSRKYPSLMGNIVFNSTVNYKSAFFESMITPVIEELNSNDKKIGPKYMLQSVKAQINSLKVVMNDEY